MKKRMIISLFIIAFFLSCKNENSLEQYFKNEKDEYWAWYDYSDQPFTGTYVKFSDKTYNTFISSENSPKEIKEWPVGGKGVPWSVTKDSFFVAYNDKQKIILINDAVIVLSSEDTLTGKYKHWFLIKEKINKDQKSSYYYELMNRRNFGPLPSYIQRVK